MDTEAGSAATEATPSGPPPPPRPRAPEEDAAVSSAEAAGGPKGAGEEGSAKPGADAVVLDLGKAPPEPEGEEERREGDFGAAADRGQGECASVVVDIKGEGAKGSSGDYGGGSWDAEKECRICHVSPDMREGSEGSELIQLGCGCKNELGIAHRHCAEAWFKLRGNSKKESHKGL